MRSRVGSGQPTICIQASFAALILRVTITKELKMTNVKITKEELRQFIGTENWYRHTLVPKVLYTDGVKYLAERAGAYWLIDAISFRQMEAVIAGLSFQVWKLKVNLAKSSAVLECSDGNGKVVHQSNIEYTDFPLPETQLYFVDNVLLLTSEY